MKKIDQLHIFRFIASILIVIFHYGEKTFPFEREPFIRIVNSDSVLVSFFFVLSGFILAYIYHQRAQEGIRFKEFMVNRLARFLPLYWLSLAVMIWYFYQISARPVFVGILEFFLVHAWVPSSLLGFNFTDWAMSVFLVFYLLFPFLYNWFVRQDIKKLTVLIVGFWIISQITIHLLEFGLNTGERAWVSDFIKYNPVFHLNSFFIGVLGGLLYKTQLDGRPFNNKINTIWMFAASILVVGIFSFRNEIQTMTPFVIIFRAGLVVPFYLLMIIFFSRDRTGVSKFLSSKILVGLGDLSFSIYLLQSPVYQTFKKYLMPRFESAFPWTEPFLFYIYLLLLISVAFFSRHWFEVPLQRVIRKYFIPSGRIPKAHA